MIVKRFGAIGALLCLAAMLGSCTPFAGFVADHWPHWAGGLPPDVPPRPGAPGYNDFIAHGEPAQTTAGPPSEAAPGATPAAASNPTDTIPTDNAAAAGAPQFKAWNDKTQPGRTPAPPARASAQRTSSQAAAPAAPVEVPPAEDTSVVKGGLY